MLTFNLTYYFYPSGAILPWVYLEQAIQEDISYSITLAFEVLPSSDKLFQTQM